ncbi:metabotropic glutamate receptor-like [Elysia marginata]|uniref:Metabotropic glutamate receptor-like n=1 Tax=Elysia marginata TaxID=1093978 RepID=A0AAV4EEC9_9GAST|nr:metabotropic glutamate receptor-like [Elysia marginata]
MEKDGVSLESLPKTRVGGIYLYVAYTLPRVKGIDDDDDDDDDDDENDNDDDDTIEDPLVVLILCLSAIGLLSVAMVTYTYIKHGDARVIKASSKELSYLQLVAIATGYLTSIVLSLKPDNAVCVTGFFMFCVSFCWLYAPLLVKAIRIHRIFQAGKSATTKLKFISPRSQIVFALLLILVQVVVCLGITVNFKPSAALTQAVPTEKFVELSCDWTLPGLVSFLTYNLVLVALCSVFAFKTRKLPDNFNESRFISLCVYTTLIIWIAFVPTYFTAATQYVRKSLLSLSLLVNHSVAIVFLYLPKIYAAAHLVNPSSALHPDHRPTDFTTGNRPLPTKIPFDLTEEQQIKRITLEL